MWRVRGTVLGSWSLWLHLVFYVAVATAAGVAATCSAERLELVGPGRVSEAANYMSLLVAVALAFYVSACVERWWEVRNTMFGGLWTAVDDLNMILAAHFPRKEHKRFKDLILRYCLLSVELVFAQARGDHFEELADLRQRQLLTDDEKDRLEGVAAKPQVVWVWIAAVFQRLAASEKLSSRLLVTLYGICTKARGSVGGLTAYNNTQLPFAYVHLTSVIVHASNLMVAVKCGVLAAVALHNLRRPEVEGEPVSFHENLHVLLLQVLSAVLLPLFTLGLLEVGVLVSDPLGPSSPDPRAAYHAWLRDECEAFRATAEKAPSEIARVAESVEVQDVATVHDCYVPV